MKNFDDLTKQELAVLTTEEVNRYINLACAEEGIPLVPDLPPKPIQPVIESDTLFYEIAGQTVRTMADAEAIQKVFNGIQVYSKSYNRCIGDMYVYEPDERSYNDPTKIHTVKAISNELYALNKQNIETYKTEKGEYDRIEGKFKSIKEKREHIEERFWNIYRDAVEWNYEMEQTKKTFIQYLDLANGDKEIAWKFLVKANEDVETIYPDLKAELGAEF
jgi:hypothetical protein